jgi:N-acetylmuramoyl-L-alanine amidase
MKSVYISPSTQIGNVGVGEYGTEQMRMNQIADIVCRELIAHGVTVYRSLLGMNLGEVVSDSNLKKPDLHLAIHSNAGGGKGCEVYCYMFGGEGERLARNVYKYLSAMTPNTDRGVHEGKNFYGVGKDMYELARTSSPAALVEVEFHDNPSGATWIVDNEINIANALVRGVLETLNIVYVSDCWKEDIQFCVDSGIIKNPEYWIKPNAFYDANFVKTVIGGLVDKCRGIK